MSAPSKPRPSVSANEPASIPDAGRPAEAVEKPFLRRHSKVINALFGALCLYVALIWLLALDQKFLWGLFGAQPPSLP